MENNTLKKGDIVRFVETPVWTYTKTGIVPKKDGVYTVSKIRYHDYGFDVSVEDFEGYYDSDSVALEINEFDKSYLDLVKTVYEQGENSMDRTGAGRRNLVSASLSFDMRKGFPLMQCKFTPIKLTIKELLWFCSGETTIKTLVEQKVNIWNSDACNYYNRLNPEKTVTLEQFISEGYYLDSNLGNSYGKYFRKGLLRVIEGIKKDPYSARHRVNMWNPEEQGSMDCALPPCHFGFQFVATESELSLVFNKRSSDLWLGLPINIASYAALLLMVAKLTGKTAKTLTFQGVNTHLYLNHLEQTKLISPPKTSGYPQLVIKGDQKSLDEFKLEDFELTNYFPNEKIKAPLNT